jgi:methyl-accepting chemotaxis protein
MVKSAERSGYFKSPWLTLARLAFSAIFFFWLYLIWNSTAGLNESIDATTDRITAIHHIQVEFKDEVQAWQDLLLRSKNQETLDQNWHAFETQFQKVSSEAEQIMAQNDVRDIHQKMKSFIDAHNINHEKYKSSVSILIKNKFDPVQADAAVKDIDEPILTYLAVSELDMLDERRRLNENLIAKARNQIEQSLFALVFIGMLAIWMPKH